MEEDTSTTTPLTQLPKNDKSDSDLVNKILTQLEEVPKDDIETIPMAASVPATTPPTPKKSKIVQDVEVSDDEVVEMRGIEDTLPSPDAIKGLYNSFNIEKVYASLKICAVYSVVFLLFLHFQNNFRGIFEKIPYIKNYIGFAGEINMTYKLLLSFLFGIVVFAIDTQANI
ncbi:MAG: hypothetical protein CML47_10445 [Rhodobacteraceae bacterium]|nr:MAG: hypothetical protein CML47_10445 [Paracoccaceae bacterium]